MRSEINKLASKPTIISYHWHDFNRLCERCEIFRKFLQSASPKMLQLHFINLKTLKTSLEAILHYLTRFLPDSSAAASLAVVSMIWKKKLDNKVYLAYISDLAKLSLPIFKLYDEFNLFGRDADTRRKYDLEVSLSPPLLLALP